MEKSPLQRELRKRNPFDSAEQEAALNVARTHDYLASRFARLFAQYDLSGPQYNVLRILRGEGLPSQEIGERMVTHMPDVTRLVDRLEKAGLVERKRILEDRRVVLVKITRAGLDVLQRLDQPVLDLHRELLGHLSASELAELNRLLARARQAG